MTSSDGEGLSGRYRFARENTGLIEVTGADSRDLDGKFVRVDRGSFVDLYQQTFGGGLITVDGPDLPASVFSGLFGSSYALTDGAYGETFDNLSGNSEILVKGPLFLLDRVPSRGQRNDHEMLFYWIVLYRPRLWKMQDSHGERI